MVGTNYEENSYNIMGKSNVINKSNSTEKQENNTAINNSSSNEDIKSTVSSGLKKAYNIGKETMNLGMYMAER